MEEKSKYDIERGIKLPLYIDDNLAYILGVLAGDGHISPTDYTIHCAGNPKNEVEFYDKVIRRLFIKLFNWELKFKHFTDGTYGFRSGSKLVHTYLVKKFNIPCGKKYNKLRIPTIIKERNSFAKYYIIGLADTDFGFCLKRRYKGVYYYPVMCLASKSEGFTKEIKDILDAQGIKTTSLYKVKKEDKRAKKGYTLTYRFDINGHKNLKMWINLFGFRNPKHLNTLKKYNKNMAVA